jgi:hypothetical protein
MNPPAVLRTLTLPSPSGRGKAGGTDLALTAHYLLLTNFHKLLGAS